MMIKNIRTHTKESTIDGGVARACSLLTKVWNLYLKKIII